MDINAGVPQGSILGPLLFILFINDIVEEIQAEVRLFADDTSIFLIVDNPVLSTERLNSDLDAVHNWAQNWLVMFNPEQNKAMTISRKVNKPIHPVLQMNSVPIQEVVNHKHLGITISNNGSWHDHIHSIVDKAYRRLNILRKYRFLLDRFSLETIYMSYIRPILEYGDIAWDNSNIGLINKIESG